MMLVCNRSALIISRLETFMELDISDSVTFTFILG